MSLSIENSWWNGGGLWQDPDLERVTNSPLKHHPQPIAIDEAVKPGVLTLRGPRRVGKTVSLKLLVADLIESDRVAARDIVWTSFDTIGTLASAEVHLYELIKQYQPKILFIDEVTSILHWQKLIKKMVDDGTLAKRSCILTGSSSFDLKRGSERLAGRKGENFPNERVLLPMTFPQFLSQLKPHNLGESQTHLLDYLVVGGFPFRVDEFLRAKLEKRAYQPRPSLSVFDDTVFYEMARRRLNRGIAIEILGRLATLGTGAVSYEAFSKPLSIARETARTYLDALGDGFLVATISTYDTSRNRVAPKKDRKLVWIDPALSDLPAYLKQAEPAKVPDKAEWLVGVEILRRCEDRIWEGLSAPRSVFTWKSSAGKELDYLIVDKSKKLLFPIEVKYQNQISDWDFQVLEQAFGKGIIVTKNEGRVRASSKAMQLSDFLSGDWSKNLVSSSQ